MAILDAHSQVASSPSDAPSLFDHPSLHGFHPAVRTWFTRRFPDGPTPPQQAAWPHIANREDTLVAAPTGSGKTLSAFLVPIDRLYRAHERGETVDGIARVMYVSPLKALAVDIAENLERPLQEIAATAKELGMTAPTIRVGVRSGDTSTSERAAMVRKPPAIIVTTPESLYLLCTSAKGRAAVSTLETVIVDEIHALARDKRGSHLALTLERLTHLCESAVVERPDVLRTREQLSDPALQPAPTRPLVRIGLSATQKPISTVANLLVGNREDATGEAECRIVNVGHVRELDLALELPPSEMEAIAPAEQMGEILDRIADQVRAHTTTLIFVNTRRMAERISHELGERLAETDEDAEANVVAHHGSLSKDRRLMVERRLRAGDLKALVATASLELGIDVGPVDLVCQLGSPRNIATFLQRVGRANHNRYGVPKGRLYPQTRDDLAECCGLLTAVHSGRLDALLPPDAPLDILIQQLVAEVAADEWEVDDLFALVTRAAPYRNLPRGDFDQCLELAAEGVRTGRGVRSHWIHHDEVNGLVRGRKGARMAAATSGGAIPELGDYRVLLDPDETFIGSVNEDWATESMPGDIFTLGTHSWRIRRIEPGVVRVVDAEGLPPTIPVWFGEAPGRTVELSEEVCHIRREVEQRLRAGDPDAARRWLMGAAQVDADAAEQVIRYLAASLAILGTLPTRDKLIIERFFDESGGMQLVVHSPNGARLNRAFGLSLRKKFCKNFDFELQAAASDDAVVLSLGPQHSFPLADVRHFLKSTTVEQTLTNAVLVPPSPMFLSRWRWNLNRSLLVLRWKGGRKNPPPIQRMEADDMMAALFPLAAACQENVSGPVELPDHVIVRQTMNDTLREAMDVDGLRAMVERLESDDIEVVCVDSTEPSPLCHELLVGKAFTFLDDAEAIDRRTRAVPLRRGLPVDLTEIGKVSPEAIAEVAGQVIPDPRTPDELHELLESLVVTRPVDAWRSDFDALRADGRVDERDGWWGVLPWREIVDDVETAVRGRLEIVAVTSAEQLARQLNQPRSSIDFVLVGLENEGVAIRGSWLPEDGAIGAGEHLTGEQWCSKRLLARMHVYSQKNKRARVDPATAQDFMRFLFEWQHLAPGSQLHGVDGLTNVVAQLQGWHAAAAAWEPHLLAGRLRSHSPDLLDRRSLAGDITWGRMAGCASGEGRAPNPQRQVATKATPITLALRNDLDWLVAAIRGPERPAPPEAGAAAELYEELTTRGARFHHELGEATGRLPADVEQGLWDLVARGLIHADSFHAVRSLFDARDRKVTEQRRSRGLRRGSAARAGGEGRWTVFAEHLLDAHADELAEAIAEQLLARWGVVFHGLVAREQLALPWREVLWALRRLEARGLIRGGRFVSGFGGEQYALPEAADHLGRVKRTERAQVVIEVNGCDPCNLTGIITPGDRVPARRANTIRYVDGLPTPTA